MQCRKILDFGLELGGAVRIAKEYGVRMAIGTDYISREQHGSNLEELALMQEAGLSVEEVLRRRDERRRRALRGRRPLRPHRPGLRVRRGRARARTGRLAASCSSREAVAAVFKAGRAVAGTGRLRHGGWP